MVREEREERRRGEEDCLSSSFVFGVVNNGYPQPGWIHKFQDKSSHRVLIAVFIRTSVYVVPELQALRFAGAVFYHELANKINDGAPFTSVLKDNTRYGVLTEKLECFSARKIPHLQYDGSFSGFLPEWTKLQQTKKRCFKTGDLNLYLFSI